ncbi:MAG: hypothetical protein HC896_18015 [Bacteroidales bacterium]|nr:hypothetical protein [Bacteroidales bacterium]
MNIVSQLLPVKYGFHTELMAPFEGAYKQIAHKINISPIRIPIVSSLNNEIIGELNEDHYGR